MAWELGKRVIDYGVLVNPATAMPSGAGCSKWNVPDDVAEQILLWAAQSRGQNKLTTNLTTGRYNLRGLCAFGAFASKKFLVDKLGEKASSVRIARVVDGGSDHYFAIVWTGDAMTSTVVDLTWTQFAKDEDKGREPYWLAGTISNLKVELKHAGIGIDVDYIVQAWTVGMQVGKKLGKAVG